MILQLLNGNKLDIANYSLRRLFHYIPSVSLSHSVEMVDGRDGGIFTDSQFTERVITVELLYESQDIQDFYLLRDEINALFTRKEAFYIIFKGEPYKRYLVKLNQGFVIEPHMYMNSFELEFACVSIFGESTSSTQQLKKEWDVNQWAWNGQITWDDDIAYSFTTNTFVVRNQGTAHIDPRQSELSIFIQGDYPSGLTLTNNTTGDVYQYTGSLTNGDRLVLDGVRTLKNGASAFIDTNKKLITLAQGGNSFTVTGGTLTKIDFDFRFLYL